MNVIKRALISVSDKTGLATLGRALSARGVIILSTGGTAQHLEDNGVPVIDVASYTGFPEMLGGRVKTLHPKVHGGLLGLRDNAEHVQRMAEHGIEPIDLLVVNLYPFESTVARGGCRIEDAIENIDIGGPAMIRSAAKNYRSVTVLTDPADYAGIIEEMALNDGAISRATNARLAVQAFARTAAYDAAICNWLSALDDQGRSGLFPNILTLQYRKRQEMRYGENPHQNAAFYVDAVPTAALSLAGAEQLQGKALSFNNINDANGAFELIQEFEQPAAVVVKHANPCGVALDDDLAAAYRKARDGDPVSAFGGIIAFNRPVSGDLAREIASTFVEAVIAPAFDADALEVFTAKKNLRLLRMATASRSSGPAPSAVMGMDLKRVLGGVLVQERDQHRLLESELRVVTRRPPTEAELRDLLFAWKVVKHVKSNAIVYAKGLASVGVGAGQMSRVDSSRIAVWKAGETAQVLKRADNPIAGSVLASDAFFPFRDGVDAAAQAGATAVIQPGGSVRDEEVIAAANEHGLAMLFTGVRHFRH